MYKRYGQSSFFHEWGISEKGERLTNEFLKSMKEANLDLEWKKRIN